LGFSTNKSDEVTGEVKKKNAVSINGTKSS